MWPVLAGVAALAFVLRCLYLFQIQNAPFFDLRLGDAAAYHEWARRIADGDWLGHEVFYQAPLYPYFLAVIYRVIGDGAMGVRLVQAAMGAASCGLLAWSGIRLWGPWGAAAGAALAVYGPAIFQDGLIDKSSLALLLTSGCVGLLAYTSERSSPRLSFALGLLLGLLVLTRENALLLAIPILLWTTRHRLVFIAGLLAVLLPIGIRNLAVGGEFHLTTSQFGSNLYIGNHEGATGSYEALVVGHGNAADERADATRLAEQAENRKLTPGQVSAYWTARAVAFIRSRPGEFLRLTARKAALTFSAAEIADTESPDVYAEWSSLLRGLAHFDFALVLGCAVFGAILSAGEWRRLSWLYGIVAAYALSVVAFYVLARYRLPMVPLLLLIGAGGVAHRNAAPRRIAIAAALAIIVVILAHLPSDDSRASRATNYYAIATMLAKDPGRVEDAAAFYRQALDADPRMPAAQFGMGTLLARTGRTGDAIPYYQAAIASWPEYQEARYNLGAALAAAGRTEEAAREYREAVRLRPDDADAHAALAKTLASMGRPEEAIREWEAGLKLDPRNASAENNLGTTLAGLGRVAEALPHFEKAAELGDEMGRKNLEAARRMLGK
jgi:tetratricopeptide (TPR) repeat protein